MSAPTIDTTRTIRLKVVDGYVLVSPKADVVGLQVTRNGTDQRDDPGGTMVVTLSRDEWVALVKAVES